MHGIIHAELKKYISVKHGPEAWTAVLKETGLGHKVYLPLNSYPDEEAAAIVMAVASLTRAPAEQIWEGFGEFIVPDLLEMYRSLIKPEWKTMEMLLHTEETIHKVVRIKNPGAEPPKLRFQQTGSNELKLYYNSPRRLAAVARGIIKGVAKQYREAVTIQEQQGADGSSEMTIMLS